VIDLGARIVKRENKIVKLTATEYSLLALMVKNEGKVLTHQQLLNQVWGPSYTNESQYLRVFVAQLRKKIEADPNRPMHIVTEPSVGYRFMSK
jgi:two-component system KDP operon response regulator KdpE